MTTELDQQIARLMEQRGFQSMKAVASAIGATERTVRRHFEDMIRRGDINVVATPNPVSCGFKAWSKIGIKVERSYLGRVARQLVDHPAVYFVAYSMGSFDIIIAVHFKSSDSLSYFVNSELASMEGILNTDTWVLACPRKYHGFTWQAPVQSGSTSEREHKGESPADKDFELDDIDWDIIRILRVDGLARPATIKSKLFLGESTIRKRIKEMQDNNVYSKQVVLNPQANQVWATVGLTTNSRDTHEVLDAIMRNSSVYLASTSLGRFNAIVAAKFSDVDLLHSFLTVELGLIDGISSTETFVHNKPLKYHNTPMPYPQPEVHARAV